MRIVIVGAGVVGAATGKGLLRRGHDVCFVDVDARRVDALRAAGLEASTAVDLSGGPSLVMVSVPTPADAIGYDLAVLRSACASIGDALRDATEHHIVVVRSTVPPGTLEGPVATVLELHAGRRDGYELAANPEFLRAECALEDFEHPWMTVVGARSRRTRERLADLYRPFGGELAVFANPAEAEMVKLAHNVYNATKISFFNELWTVANHLGLDTDRVAQAVSRSAEASWNPGYGIRGGRPFAGACLPKDVQGFLAFARERGLPVPMTEATRSINDRLAAVIDLRDQASSPEPPATDSVGRL